MAFHSEELRDILAGSERVGNPRGNSRSTVEALTSTPHSDAATFGGSVPSRQRPQVVIEDTLTNPESRQAEPEPALAQDLGQLVRYFTTQVEKMNSRRDKPCRTFTGQIYENPRAFAQYMDNYFRNNNIEEDFHQIDLFRTQLRDAAKKWAQPLENIPMTYRAFRDSFLRYYDSNAVRNEATAVLYGERQKAGESVELFLNRKRCLFNRVDPSIGEMSMAEILKDQLIPPIKSRLRHTEFLDMGELLSQAGRIENDVKEEAEYWEKINPRTSRQSQLNSSSGPSPDRRVQFQASLNRTGGPPSPCRFCGQWHFNNDCPRNPFRDLNSRRVPEERGRSAQRTETRSSGAPRSPTPTPSNRTPTLRANQLQVIAETEVSDGPQERSTH